MNEQANDDEKSIGSRFDECQSTVNELEFGWNSVSAENIEKCVESLKKLKTMVDGLDLISKNDTLEDIPTSSLRYLLLDVYLARVLENRQVPIDERLDLLQESQKLYRDFLLMADVYAFNSFPATQTEVDTTDDANKSSVLSDIRDRQRKMERVDAEDKLKHEIQSLRLECNKGSDEAVQRSLELKKLQLWCLLAQNAIERNVREIQMLEYRKSLPTSGQRLAEQPRQPLKTFVIPKSEEKKKVFGLGYPSAPTQTVNEWYDQMSSRGHFGPSAHQSSAPQVAAEDASNEEDIDSEEARKKQAAKDEYLDSHRRGWGNKHGKG
ncbi:hypothetical protein M3Y98_00140200 [Aphelenchoides besseyi]|nr:hypothetical protein M3Y98_00140200 [Aphelenchoides besseyi]KAI6199694.1 hypothetical protein M3Y96_00654000 [Aphelenchoides besseyi]